MDYIIISDEEDDIEYIEQIVNLDAPTTNKNSTKIRKPILIDLTLETPLSQQRYQSQTQQPFSTHDPKQHVQQPTQPEPAPPSQPQSQSQPQPAPPSQKQQSSPQRQQNGQPPKQYQSQSQPEPPKFHPFQQQKPPQQPPQQQHQSHSQEQQPSQHFRQTPQPQAQQHPAQQQQQQPSQPQPPPQPQKTVVSDFDTMMAQKNLGNEKYKKNCLDEAIRLYRKANELAMKLGDNEMSAILHFNLAMTYFKLGSYDQAADECANAVKINDKYMKAHLKRAEIYQRQFKFEEAVICYEHICELDNTNQDYRILLNKAREAAKQLKKKDYYLTLGLTTNVTKQDLKQAYRQHALKHHPDRHSDADTVTRRIQEKYFKDVSEAHTFIKSRFCNYQ